MPESMSQGTAYHDDLKRIEEALEAASIALRQFTPGAIDVVYKSGHDPVTAADHAANDVLRRILLRKGEGWLSEETTDDLSRRSRRRVWIVDPLDGTREFVDGIPEWCTSVAMIADGEPVAGGICNPATGEMILGARGVGVTYNHRPAKASNRETLQGATVLASRSELRRGEWAEFQQQPFTVRPMGSVAYKLGLVAAGVADATWTLTPKHEWDVAAGVALVRAAGGFARSTANEHVSFNSESLLLPGLIAGGPLLEPQILAMLDGRLRLAAHAT